jgi:glycosyltransferase involved in cell wall biosynthesis
MARIIYIPIEPLQERYSQQWYDNFPKAFKTQGYETIVIDGIVLSDTVEVGTFLDINSTIHYKCAQLQTISKMFRSKQIQDGDIFFFGDLEFWGIESVRLLADLNQVDIKITAFLHAASYTIEDAFAIAEPYQRYTEVGWISICDFVFVGSEYHKQAVVDRRLAPVNRLDLADRIVVTGNPLWKEDYALTSVPEKRDQLIISNRFDWEKRPNLSLDFAYILKKRNPDLQIMITTSRNEFKSNKQWLVDYATALEKDGIVTIKSGLSKAEYHEILAQSKVMLTNSIEENFGYCIIESCVYNTYPVLKNALSHPELVQGDERLLFNDEDEVVSKIERLLSADFSVVHYAENYFYSIDRIMTYINTLSPC